MSIDLGICSPFNRSACVMQILWFYLNSDDNALGWFQTACLDRIAVYPDQLSSECSEICVVDAV